MDEMTESEFRLWLNEIHPGMISFQVTKIKIQHTKTEQTPWEDSPGVEPGWSRVTGKACAVCCENLTIKWGWVAEWQRSALLHSAVPRHHIYHESDLYHFRVRLRPDERPCVPGLKVTADDDGHVLSGREVAAVIYEEFLEDSGWRFVVKALLPKPE